MKPAVAFDVSALDPNFKEHAQRGIGRYVRELKRYFESVQGRENLEVTFFDHRKPGVGALNGLSRLADFIPLGRTTIRQQILAPGLLGTRPESLIHFPAQMDAPSWGRRSYVLTVLDLIPLVFPDLYKANRVTWRFKLARFFELKAITNASLLLCISECTARDVERILGVPREKMIVTPLGVDDKFLSATKPDSEQAFRSKYRLPQTAQLVLYVGGIDPRKNYPVLLKAFAEVVARARNAQKSVPTLVLVGNISSDREYPRLIRLIEELSLQDTVAMTGYLPDEDLTSLYAIASAFFFPSLYEGFGLTPLEAMAAGLPVVSSNSSAMPEVLGDAACLVDPGNVTEAATALEGVLTNHDYAANLRALGPVQARKFTWAATGQKTIEAYKQVLNSQASI